MMIDVNANLSRWPLRRTPCDEMPRLIATYQKHGVGQAWVGSLDGVLHRDIGGVNRRLADDCRRQQDVELVPFGSVNPMLPDWQEDIRRCAEDHRMPGIRLHPNYHGYRLDDPAFAELLDLAVQHSLIVQVVVRMDDARTQHPLLQIPDVDTAALADVIRPREKLRLVLLNGPVRLAPGLSQLLAERRFWIDIAAREGVGGIARLLNTVPPEQVLFGSHLPLFPLESSVLKVQEAGLDDGRREAVEQGNARQLLASRKR